MSHMIENFDSVDFENKIIEIRHKAGVNDKTARTQIYKEMQYTSISWINASNKMKCLYQYAIKYEIVDPDKFSIVTESEKNRWVMECFCGDLDRYIRFYQGGIERKEDLTDRDRLIGEELLRRKILKGGSSTR
ncbi:8212_t:CDS:2 [Diversispora eburnea]|uniref:8212_t:CDS:1 n=1 Tax=Diversispora eburnea TaxID=1213867 RepID=A0A9N9BU55_9GLOM|nr:8212_t:CDS:2 [Diversispora eburnea]